MALSITIILTLFFLSCSISSSFFVMVYFFLKRDFKRRSSRLMICMAFADFVGATFWFADIMYSVCPAFLILNIYGYQSAQMWSSLIGAYLVLKFSEMRLPPEIVFHIIAWGFPCISLSIILSQSLYYPFDPPQGCWLPFGETEMLVLAVPQVFIVVVNLIFVGIIFLKTRQYTKSRWGFRNRDKSLLYIQICCIVTTFSSILQSLPNAPELVYSVSFVLGASQGFINTLSMRQRMVFRFFSWTHRVPGLLHQQANKTKDRIYAVAVKERRESSDVAPSSALLAKPFGTYKTIPASEIN